MKAGFKKYTLRFKTSAGTSRGVYTERNSWFIFLEKENVTGIGECAPLPGLSIEPIGEMDTKLSEVCSRAEYFSQHLDELIAWPSIVFGLESALLDLRNGGKCILLSSDFTESKLGIPINGLIWMGDVAFMKKQIREKIEQGFRCIKLKIGSLDFDTEFELLKKIRQEYNSSEIVLRVDANGAFPIKEALDKLKMLSELEIHSIEQPIRINQWEEMARLCELSPLAIALDEELIGVMEKENKKKLLEYLNPSYLVLKPSLHGGIGGCDEWIGVAEAKGIKWWITSYLESNIGLNAIAQWAATKPLNTEQGLGTGQLFINNFSSPLTVIKDRLWYLTDKQWNIELKDV